MEYEGRNVILSVEEYTRDLKESNELKKERNYFKALANVIMLAAAALSPILCYKLLPAPLPIWRYILYAVLFYIALWIIRAIFHATVSRDAGQGNISGFMYIIYAAIPIIAFIALFLVEHTHE